MVKKHSFPAVGLMATLLVSSVPGVLRGAEPATTAPAVGITEALKQLTADDYQVRQAAVDNIQAALARNIHDMLALNDPEAHNRMNGVLDFNVALSRWAQGVLALPSDQRRALAAWGTTPAAAPLVAKVYGKDAAQRTTALAELVKSPDPAVNTLLAMLLHDEDSAVRQASLVAAKDRPANPVIVNALWDMATGAAADGPAGMVKVNGLPPNVRMMMKRAMGNMGNIRINGLGAAHVVIGGNVNGVPFGNMGGMTTVGPSSDDALAVEALIAAKDPTVADRVRAFIHDGKLDLTSSGVQNLLGGDAATQNVIALAAAYHVQEALPHLMKIVSNPSVRTDTVSVNGQSECTSDRTDAMAAVCQISGQKPEDYDLHKSAQLGAWVVPNGAAESAAAEKLTKWYQSQTDHAPLPTVPPTTIKPAPVKPTVPPHPPADAKPRGTEI